MRNILCFGDSNTFGHDPAGGRHGRAVRWPGRLQALLGPDYHLIEEGLGGRTTVWENPLEPGRSGLAALPMLLDSHRPLDLVILSLGTNDCKTHLGASPAVIARGAALLCQTVLRHPYGEGFQTPQVLLVAPIHMGKDWDACPFEDFDETSGEKAAALGALYWKVAREQGCRFLDASTVAWPGADGLHMDGAAHEALATAFAKVIPGYFT